MKISEIMHKNPKCVTPDDTLINIAKLMKEGDFGAVIVKEGEKPIGMITDRDIIVRALANGENPTNLKAKQIMTKNLITCHAKDSLEDTAQKMGSNQIRRLPVLDEQNQLIGILSLGDIALSEKGKETGLCFKALEAISKQH